MGETATFTFKTVTIKFIRLHILSHDTAVRAVFAVSSD